MRAVKFTILAFLFIISIISFSKSNKAATPINRYEPMETNYIAGLNSGDPGLQVSSAYFLGEMKSREAVLPLLKIFREEKNDNVRLAAAWSLIKIGNSLGTYLVKRECYRGEYEQIRFMLHQLYRDNDFNKHSSIAAN